MLESLLSVVQSIAALVVVAYLVMTFQSAIRMAMVHDRYAHIEFNGPKWKSYGKWAPNRLRWLPRLRSWAIFSVIVLVAVTFWKAYSA